ncbi:hypothetical protein J4G33_14385 [Actinotalea sp. BY-33]|uniref:RAMA domain-containing protein n=1 Tax=Actinotalea soli TaxID=2819234 RepID=A0A939LQR8_9CELL|nr:hypothetical protein [Actinotalea soli]MBO1752997.1 hypothetical protein [Actinotalea soli]
MPMFEVEGGRSTPVQPLQPARTSFGTETSSVVADHLDSLLGEQLLPLRARRAGRDEPHLLAVDAAGQPVVVEVVAVLDEAACIRALRYAGRAARLSTQDLAQAYRGGPDRFAAHLASFRETVPVTSLLSPSVRSGSRLLLVCSEVDHGAEDALEFLLQPGWQVEVLQVGVIEGADGRRIVDVSPVVRTPPPRRAMEPTALHVVRDDERVGVPSASAPRTWPVPRVPTPDPEQARGRADTPVWDSTSRSWDTSTPSRGTAALQPRVPTVVAPPFAVRAAVRPPAPAPAPEPAPAPAAPPAEPAPVRERVSARAPERYSAPAPERAPVPPTEPASAPRPAADLPYAFTGIEPPPLQADPELAALAARIGEPMALVWIRLRRGVRYEALLRPDGLLELVDGSLHADPDAAATAASGAESVVDGWRSWRLGDGQGPTLVEALRL